MNAIAAVLSRAKAIEASTLSGELAPGVRVIFGAHVLIARGVIDSIEDGWVFWTEDGGALHCTRPDWLRKETKT